MTLKHRIVGIIVLVALAIITIPIFMSHSQLESDHLKLSSKVPKPPSKPNIALALPPQNQTYPQSIPSQNLAEGVSAVHSEAIKAASPKSIAATSQAPVQETIKTAEKTLIKTSEKENSAAKKVKITPAPAQAWVVQLGTFSDKANAENLVRKLKSGGFNAYIHESATEQAKLIRVLVGPDIQHANAQQTVQRLEKLYNLKGIITKYKL